VSEARGDEAPTDPEPTMTFTFCTVPASLETRTGAAHKAKLAAIAAIMRRVTRRDRGAE
jgi:hypothetical protein